MWGRRIGTGLRLPSYDMWWGGQVVLGKCLKGLLLPLAHGDKLILWLCVQGEIEKKAFAKFSIAWYTPRTVAKISKMVAIWGTIARMGDTTLLNSQQPMVTCHEPSGFFTCHTSLLETVWAECTITRSGQFGDSFSYLIMPDRQFTSLDSYQSLRKWVGLLVSSWRFPSASLWLL